MIVEFDATAFRNRHPFFTEEKISDVALEFQFATACTVIDNRDDGLVPYDPAKNIFDRAIVLDALICHLSIMAMRDPTQAGAIASASEGSVSVSYQATPQMDRGFFSQTTCGQTFLQLMRKYICRGGLQVHPSNFHPYG